MNADKFPRRKGRRRFEFFNRRADTFACGAFSPSALQSCELAHVRLSFGNAQFLPLPATKEWGEDRGEGPSKAVGANAPPLPGPLLPPTEERGWLRLCLAAFIRVGLLFK